jgi:hypothetical protein
MKQQKKKIGYFDLYAPRKQMGRQKIGNWMVVSVPRNQSVIDFM